MSDGGMSKTRLSRLTDVLGGYVERGQVSGVVTLVGRHGEVRVDAIGKTAIGGSDPVQRDTIFRIASMTKPVTAAATMILVEECKLRLDEPVDRLLPELSGGKVLKRLDGPLTDTVPADRPISVRDLLTFRMGFGGIFAPPGTYPIQAASEGLSLEPPNAPTPDEWIARLGALPLLHQPGEKWMYSTGSDVLGVLIARSSGQPFESFLRERLFEPLGMTDTGFSVPAAKLGRLAASYWTDPGTGELTLHDQPPGSLWSNTPTFASGAGTPYSCLVSTVDDYMAFAQMMLNGGKLGGERVLSRPSVEAMTTDHLTPAQKAASGFFPGYFDSRGWGFGLSVVTRRDHPALPVGTFGWDGGLGTVWRSDPREDMITILMSQSAWTSPTPPDICLDFWTTAYQAIDD
jgi:CubicO group peptidase (beta-lactamase class C family)